MSEQMLEQIREYNRITHRFVEVAGYIDNSPRVAYSKSEVQKMMTHVLKGGGWI